MKLIDILYQNSVLWYSNLKSVYSFPIIILFWLKSNMIFWIWFCNGIIFRFRNVFKCSVFFYWRFAGKELLPFGQIETNSYIIDPLVQLEFIFSIFFLDMFTFFKNLCSWIKNNIDFLVNRSSTLYFTQNVKRKKHFYR